MTADKRVPVATERCTALVSRAPKACAVWIAKPLVRPQVKPMMRKTIEPVAPTAARASTPRVQPTTMASANW